MKNFKAVVIGSILAAVVLGCLGASTGMRQVPYTTAATRDFLTNETVAGLRSYLGVAGSNLTFEATQFVLTSSNLSIISGATLTNQIIKGAQVNAVTNTDLTADRILISSGVKVFTNSTYSYTNLTLFDFLYGKDTGVPEYGDFNANQFDTNSGVHIKSGALTTNLFARGLGATNVTATNVTVYGGLLSFRTNNTSFEAGLDAYAVGTLGVTIGNIATNLADSGSVVIGYNAIATNDIGSASAGNVAVGGGAIAKGSDGGVTAVGQAATAVGSGGTSIGSGTTSADSGTAVGYLANATSFATAIGQSSEATASSAVAIGSAASASASSAVAIGVTADVSGSSAVGVGNGVTVSGNSSVGLGFGAQSTGTSGLALGALAGNTATRGFAIGNSATNSGTQSFAIGYQANVSGTNSAALGNNVTNSADNTLLIGSSAHTFKVGASNMTVVGITVHTPSSLQTVAAGNAISANATRVRVVGSGGAVTLTSTPTIADGIDGQILYIFGTSANTVTVQDEGTLVGSNLQLGDTNRIVGSGDILALMFDSTLAAWFEISFADN